MPDPNTSPSDFDRERWRSQHRFDRQKWREEIKFRNREIEIKEREQAQKADEYRLRVEELRYKADDTKPSRWSNPLVFAILGATVVGALNIVLAARNTNSQLTLDNERATKARELEEYKSKAAIDLDERKSEMARILEMIKTSDPDKAAENLKFLVDAGLIADATRIDAIRRYLAARTPGSGVVLPASTAEPAPTMEYSCTLAQGVAKLVAPKGYVVTVASTARECTFSVNGAGAEAQMLACKNINAKALLPPGNVTSIAESKDECRITVAGAG